MNTKFYIVLMSILIGANWLPKAFAQEASNSAQFVDFKKVDENSSDENKDKPEQVAEEATSTPSANPTIQTSTPVAEEKKDVPESRKADIPDFKPISSYWGIRAGLGGTGQNDNSIDSGFSGMGGIVGDSMGVGYFYGEIAGGGKPHDEHGKNTADNFKLQGGGRYMPQKRLGLKDDFSFYPMGLFGAEAAIGIGSSGDPHGKIEGIIGVGPGFSIAGDTCRIGLPLAFDFAYGSDKASVGPGASLDVVCGVNRFYGRLTTDGFYNILSKDPNVKDETEAHIATRLNAGILVPTGDDTKGNPTSNVMLGIEANGQVLIQDPTIPKVDDTPRDAVKLSGTAMFTFTFVPGSTSQAAK